jgi:hypothetical protein
LVKVLLPLLAIHHEADKNEAYCEAIRLTHRRTIDTRADFVVRTIGALLVDLNDFARQEAYRLLTTQAW